MNEKIEDIDQSGFITVDLPDLAILMVELLDSPASQRASMLDKSKLSQTATRIENRFSRKDGASII